MWGPFEECPHNPIIRAADQNAYFQTIGEPPPPHLYFANPMPTAGHADIFQSTQGDWFAVALATRDGRVNFPLGRETVLIPGRWDIGSWPTFDARVETLMNASEADSRSPRPPIDEDMLASFAFKGHGSGKEEVGGEGVIWPHNVLRLRNPDERAYSFSRFPDSGQCRLRLRPSSKGDRLDARFGSPSFVARRQTEIECSVELQVQLPLSRSPPAGYVAGLSVYLDFESHIDLVLSPTGLSGRWQAAIRRRVPSTATPDAVVAPPEQPVTLDTDATPAPAPNVGLRVLAYVDRYEFSIRRAGESVWVPVGSGLAKDVSGGFTGVVIGPFVEAPPSDDADRVGVDVRKWVYAERTYTRLV